MTTVATGYRSVLSIKGMRSVFVAHAVSMMGTVAAQVALSILVFQRTGSAFLSALVLVCSFLPFAVGGTVLSSIADRFPARRVLVCCDLISAACVAVMLVPGVSVPALLALLLLAGTVAPVFQGARAASLAHLLGPDVFPLGRSLLRAIGQLTVLTGFAVGAVAVAAVGPTWLLALDVASFLASAALIGFGTPFSPASAAGKGLLRASTSGLRHVFGRAPLRRLMLLSWAVPAFSSMPDGLAVAYTAQTGAAATTAGVMFTGYAAGTVLGEVVVSRLAPATRRRLVVPLILASQVPAITFVLTPSIPLAAVLLAVSGAGFAFNQGIDPLILAASDPSYRGRLFTVQSSGLMAVQGVGIALAGLAGTFVRPGLVICVAGLIGTTLTLALTRRALHQP